MEANNILVSTIQESRLTQGQKSALQIIAYLDWTEKEVE